jgi:hypothetical protein
LIRNLLPASGYPRSTSKNKTRWGERVRLEQERIAWPAALEAISNALGNHQ